MSEMLPGIEQDLRRIRYRFCTVPHGAPRVSRYVRQRTERRNRRDDNGRIVSWL